MGKYLLCCSVHFWLFRGAHRLQAEPLRDMAHKRWDLKVHHKATPIHDYCIPFGVGNKSKILYLIKAICHLQFPGIDQPVTKFRCGKDAGVNQGDADCVSCFWLMIHEWLDIWALGYSGSTLLGRENDWGEWILGCLGKTRPPYVLAECAACANVGPHEWSKWQICQEVLHNFIRCTRFIALCVIVAFSSCKCCICK